MSIPTRSISYNKVAELYSGKPPVPRPSSVQLPFEDAKIIDTVSISDAAKRKLDQWKEEARATGLIAENQPVSIRDQSMSESLRVLGIDSKEMSLEGIKKAFVSAVKKYHPDLHSRSDNEVREIAEDKTRQIIAAYENIRKMLLKS